MHPMTPSPVAVVVLVLLVCCAAVRGDDPGEVIDCTFDENLGGGIQSGSALAASTSDYVLHNIYCYNEFEPCDTGNGCCYKGLVSFIHVSRMCRG